MRASDQRLTERRRAARPCAPGLAKAATGIAGIDQITDGGLPRGRPTLVCGAAGCGKTLFAMEFLVRGALQFDEPGVFVAFEETADELRDDVRSLGFDLDCMVKRGELIIDHVRIERSEIEETGDYNLDGLFIRIGHAIATVKARRVVLDTIEALFSGFSSEAVLRAELRRLFRWLKDQGVTAVITGERGDRQLTRRGLEEYVSDCVIVLDQRIHDQVSTRRLRIVKYRGTAHGTNEYPFLIEFLLTSSGIELRDAYLGAHGVLTGSARLGQEARDREDELNRLEDAKRVQSDLADRRQAIETEIAALQDQLRMVAGDLERVTTERRRRGHRLGDDRRAMSASRHAAKSNGARSGR